MILPYPLIRTLRARPRTWLVTGVAGFIGSNLLEALLTLDQRVVGLDNFATGHRRNLDEVRDTVPRAAWSRFRFLEGDLTDPAACRRACRGVEVISHQAALGSVPRSFAEPVSYHATNVTGFVNLLGAARDAGIRRFVYASSSSVYGDTAALPKVEEDTGLPLSPYALTKQVNEQCATMYGRWYGLETVGLRYFNVFGPRQDPAGMYAAVIPRWIDAMQRGEPVHIHGDGRTSRDFCHVDNVVQANLRAGITRRGIALNQAYNVACGVRTTLNELFELLRQRLLPGHPHLARFRASHGPARPGDIRHSVADISKAARLLGYAPTRQVADGLDAALAWYCAHPGA